MSTDRGWLRRAGVAFAWVLIVVEALAMGAAGFAKFGSPDVWTALFTGWGYPVWFTYVVGAGELAGALLLLVPRLASYAAGFLIIIMIGALATVLIHDSQLGPVAPGVHIGVLTIILLVRRQGRWRGRAPTARTRTGAP